MRWLALLILALALVAAGCGGSDDESSASDDTTIEETTTVEETEDTDDGSASGEFDFGDEDCRGLAAAFVGLSGAISAAATGGDSDLTDELEEFTELAGDVPDDIKADVETLAQAYDEVVQVLADAGIQAGQVPSAEQAQQLQDALQSIGSEEITAASERVGAWTTANCSG
jgi:hypothetical protein